jgi:hypothetical protein
MELAYTHHDRFDRVVWFKAPDEGPDITDALSRFARKIEAQLPELLFAHLLEDERTLARFVPSMTEFAERNRVLVVVDNAESLLTTAGSWRDNGWRLVIAALTAHQGPSRRVITSRRPVNERPWRLQAEPVHALSRDEAVLLARELPHLRAWLDGRAQGLSPAAARQLATWVLAAAQGHPQLLELADGQAADGESAASAEDYTDVLTAWTRTVADGLPEEAQAFSWFLCSLEESDRHAPSIGEVIAENWANTRSRLDRQGTQPRSASWPTWSRPARCSHLTATPATGGWSGRTRGIHETHWRTIWPPRLFTPSPVASIWSDRCTRPQPIFKDSPMPPRFLATWPSYAAGSARCPGCGWANCSTGSRRTRRRSSGS